MFTPRDTPHIKRHFCGFCGTPLSHWSEENPDEAEWISVAIGSLSSDSLGLLDDIGLLPTIDDREDDSEYSMQSKQLKVQTEGREIKGQPWFEDIIEGSELGRIRRRRGGEAVTDGLATVEWEVVEFNTKGVASEGGTGKRKLEDLVEGEDTPMKEIIKSI